VNHTTRGILLFCANVFFGTMVDAPAKLLQHNGVPIFTVVFLRYAIALLALIILLLWRGQWPSRSQNIKVNLFPWGLAHIIHLRKFLCGGSFAAGLGGEHQFCGTTHFMRAGTFAFG
jgi:drug/metabolite transporter (DMT)-like permease